MQFRGVRSCAWRGDATAEMMTADVAVSESRARGKRL